MKFARRVHSLAVTALLVLAGATSAAAQTYVEDGLRAAGKQQVIITVAPDREAEVLETLKLHGVSVSFQYPSINAIVAVVDGKDLSDLAEHGAVSITADHPVHLSATPHARVRPVHATTDGTATLDANATQPQNVSTLRLTLGLSAGSACNVTPSACAPATKPDVNGTGVRVAIIDSGLAASALGDFINPVQFFDSSATGKPVKTTVFSDELGHGTHIAGLIASSGALTNYMFQGVAPNASLLIFKVLDKNGASRSSTVIAAIDYIVKNNLKLGVQVINLSLGHPVTAPAKFDPLVQAVENAVRNGITVVIAAGNDGPGYGSINSPGNSPSAITVGAADGKATITRDDDYVPSFSSRGPTWYDGLAKPDVVAPGVNLFSDAVVGSTLFTTVATDPKTNKPVLDPTTGQPVLAFPRETFGTPPYYLIDLSGTSMATAVATGVVALEYDANRNPGALTPNTVKAVLEYTSVKVANADVLTQGAGQINAAGAIQLAGAINPTAPLNTGWLVSPVNGSSVIGAKSLEWDDNIIWGTSLIGGQFMFYRGQMWDDNIIWGTGLIKGTRLVGAKSGDNIIWGTNIDVLQKNLVFGKDDDNIIWGTSKNLAQFRVIGERVGKTIVWNRDGEDNIIWGTLDDDNIIWGTDDGDNIIWGTWSSDGDNIIWGTTDDDNIIWGTSDDTDNIIWGTSASLGQLVHSKKGIQIVWGADDSDNIIWGTADDGDNIIWGTDSDNIIWGTDDGDNIIWGTWLGSRN